MSAEIYLYFRIIIASILLVFGVGLTFGILPKKLRNTIFDSSRRVMGVAIMALPIATITSYSPRFIYLGEAWGTLIHLISVFLITILVAISFTSLLGNHITLKSKRFWRAMIVCVVYPIPLAIAILYNDSQLINIIKTTTSLILFATIIYECMSFYLLYQNAIKRVNNYYSDDIAVNITWLHNSALFMLSIGLISGIAILSPSIPIWGYFMITIYRCFVFLYVFYSFMRFIKSFANMENVNTPDHNPFIEFAQELDRPNKEIDNITKMELDIKNSITQKLDVWIEQKNYTHKNITLQSLSDEISTNRSYLSYYINSTFKCSFKTWITELRIKQAKNILADNPELSISEIANVVGFLSTNSFTHSFKRIEGVAPTRWRQRNPQRL